MIYEEKIINALKMIKSICYEVVRHYKGKSSDYDIVVTGYICLTKEEAIELVEELNYIAKKINLDYTYFWRMRA